MISVKRLIVILSAISSLFCSLDLRADEVEVSVRHLTYEEAAIMALRDNPDLLAIRETEEGFKLRSKQALAPNNPIFSYTKADVPGFRFLNKLRRISTRLTILWDFQGRHFHRVHRFAIKRSQVGSRHWEKRSIF